MVIDGNSEGITGHRHEVGKDVVGVRPIKVLCGMVVDEDDFRGARGHCAAAAAEYPARVDDDGVGAVVGDELVGPDGKAVDPAFE